MKKDKPRIRTNKIVSKEVISPKVVGDVKTILIPTIKEKMGEYILYGTGKFKADKTYYTKIELILLYSEIHKLLFTDEKNK